MMNVKEMCDLLKKCAEVCENRIVNSFAERNYVWYC